MPVTINKTVCHSCGQSIGKIKRYLSKDMVRALSGVVAWCEAKGRHEFKRSEVAHIINISEDATANFSYLPYFGGMVYRPDTEGRKGDGWYGVNIERAKAFLEGRSRVRLSFWKVKGGGAEPDETSPEITVGEIPNIGSFLKDGKMVVEYAL